MEAAIQQTTTLPGWFVPSCRNIIDSPALTSDDKIGFLQHQFATIGTWGTRTAGDAGSAGASQSLKGLTNDYLLGLIPETTGIPETVLRATLTQQGFGERVINLALGRMTKNGKYILSQNGVLFRAQSQGGQTTGTATGQTGAQQEEQRRVA